ncbi:hypothetical protein ACHAXT_013361 [Thalassiosira profunda]
MASSAPPEEVLVLYGSQTGNSEAAAETLESALPFKLLDPAPCTARCMQLDDFLELEKAKWPRLVVIVCSSYGVGQAPLGARKFREVCDALLDSAKEGKVDKFLAGVHFALLGLGDSHYTTFFRNPTVIHEALTAAGATRVGPLGKADASGTGDDEQGKVVERWIAGIWDELATVYAATPPGEEALEKAREGTWEVCLEVFPEWQTRSSVPMALAIVAVIVSLLVAYYIQLRA